MLVMLESGRLEQAVALVVKALFSKVSSPPLNPMVAEDPHSIRLQSYVNTVYEVVPSVIRRA